MAHRNKSLTHSSSSKSLKLESLEDRRMLAVTLQDFQDAGIGQQAIDAINSSQYVVSILADETLENVVAAIERTQTAPAGATVLSSVADLSQITAGTVNDPNIYLIQGDLTITENIDVPSNVHIYVDGSIFKQGAFTAPGGVHSVENGEDAIFFLDNADNVKLIGIDNALLHSNPDLSPAAPHATAVYIGFDSDNVEVDGFEIANVWEGVVARSGGLNIDNTVITNNYIHDTVGRAIWSIGTIGLEAAHNFIENAGVDGLDWDAFTDSAIGYENVVIGAGRWAGFVEEAAHDSYFIRGLSLIVDLGNPNRGFMLGWADNGTTIGVVNNSGQQTRDNYFIDNVVFDPGNIPNSGGDYFAKANSGGKGQTYFWANRGFGAGQSQNNFDNAEWLDTIPTAGGASNAVNGVQLLADLDAKYNPQGLDDLAGDFNSDGTVDGADLSQWESDYAVNGNSDADNDGDSDGADFLAWQVTFGNSEPTGPVTLFSYDTDFTAAEGFSAGALQFQQGWLGQNVNGLPSVDPTGDGSVTSDGAFLRNLYNVGLTGSVAGSDDGPGFGTGDGEGAGFNEGDVISIEQELQFTLADGTSNQALTFTGFRQNFSTGGFDAAPTVGFKMAYNPFSAESSGSFKLFSNPARQGFNGADNPFALIVDGTAIGLDSQPTGGTADLTSDNLLFTYSAQLTNSASNEWTTTELTITNLDSGFSVSATVDNPMALETFTYTGTDAYLASRWTDSSASVTTDRISIEYRGTPTLAAVESATTQDEDFTSAVGVLAAFAVEEPDEVTLVESSFDDSPEASWQGSADQLLGASNSQPSSSEYDADSAVDEAFTELELSLDIEAI